MPTKGTESSKLSKAASMYQPKKSARPWQPLGRAGPSLASGHQSPIGGRSFPVTTAQLIGWKSTRPDNKLEIYGHYAPKARGKIGILNIFDWPQQSL